MAVNSICVVGGWGHMGSFHVKRLEQEYPELAVYIDDMGAGVHEPAPDCDAYIIATPDNTHYEIAKDLIAKGKHVLVEKPISLSYCKAQLLYRLAQKYNVVLMAGHTERFNSVFRDWVPRLQGHSELTYYRASIGYGNNLIFDTMIHDLELALYLNDFTDIKSLKIDVLDSEAQRRRVSIDGLGVFHAEYGAIKDIRYINGSEAFCDLLNKPQGKDSLFYEHQHFFSLCGSGHASDHAKYAVAAVGLAERIQEEIDGL